MLDAQKSPWPRTIIATKTKNTSSRVVVAVVACFCPLFLYQNAAVLYLNADVAIFCAKEIFLGPTKKLWWVWCNKQKTRLLQGRCFFFAAPKPIWALGAVR